VAGHFEHVNKSLGVIKCGQILEQLLAFQEGPCSIGLVDWLVDV